MRKVHNFLLLCILIGSFFSSYAQSSWRDDADTYLKTVFAGDEYFESPEKLEKLRTSFQEDFGKGNQDFLQTQLLVLLSIQENVLLPEAHQKVLKAYKSKPFEKALFLLDFAASRYDNE